MTGDNGLGRSKKKEEETLPGLEEDGRQALPESGFHRPTLSEFQLGADKVAKNLRGTIERATIIRVELRTMDHR